MIASVINAAVVMGLPGFRGVEGVAENPQGSQTGEGFPLQINDWLT